MPRPTPAVAGLTNAEIADRLSSLAQLLSSQGENPYKIKAYRRAAETIRSMGASIDELVHQGADLTAYAGIGQGISSALRELVQTGTLGKLDALRAQVPPEMAAISEYPRLDPRRVQQIYRRLKIGSVDALRAKLAAGEIGRTMGARLEHHVRHALTESQAMLLYEAEDVVAEIETFLYKTCGATRVAVTGEYRRRVEVVSELSFLIETADFPAVVEKLQRFGGRAELQRATARGAELKLASGIRLHVATATTRNWGLALLVATGAEAHLQQLEKVRGGLRALAKLRNGWPDEAAVYARLGLGLIPPELREGHDELRRAARGRIPELVTLPDLRGELHAHSTTSDGAHTIEEMAADAHKRGYAYLGITDHSQSLKIAGGVSVADLRKQLRRIDRWNAKRGRIRLLKAAEVDILADGSLDYPDDLLRQLDYTICSIHSRFALNKEQQTERILRAMDNRHFTILGHATGRLLLRRPGYELDFERIVEHARQRGCCFEINASPDRLDLSAEHARLAARAGVKIAICTDAHSTHEFDFIRWGLDQARRAGLTRADVLNCLTWPELKRALKR